jgi:hypothetical protein
MDGSHDVYRKGLYGNIIGKADEGLGSKMKNKIRPQCGYECRKAGTLGQIAAVIGGEPRREVELLKESGFREGVEGVTMDLRAEGEEPLCQPSSFESGVAGEEDAFSCVSTGKGVQGWRVQV